MIFNVTKDYKTIEIGPYLLIRLQTLLVSLQDFVINPILRSYWHNVHIFHYKLSLQQLKPG